ncbi:unnamed protein product, partial [Brassica oleracea]
EREAIEGDWSERAVSRESEMVRVIGRPEFRRRFSFFDSESGESQKRTRVVYVLFMRIMFIYRFGLKLG